MDEEMTVEPLRDRLIVAGTEEISRHGIADFSLRRVAAACGTSCAAPYKHFKNKEAFISEIVRYINRQWELLRTQILSLFADDLRKGLTEVCIAYIRFWVANPNYRSVLVAAKREAGGRTDGEYADVSAEFSKLCSTYCQECNKSESETERISLMLQATLLGITAMLENGELENNDESFEKIRDIFEFELND